MGPWWFSFALLVFAAAGLRAVLIRRRAVRTLQRLAYDHRLSFSSEDLIGLPERYQNLTLLRRGHSRCVSDVVHGTTEVGLLSLFCQNCDLGFGVHQTSLRWWVAVIEASADFGCWRFSPPDTVPTTDGTRFTHQRQEVSGLLEAERASTLHAVSHKVLPEVGKQEHRVELEAHHHLLAVVMPFAPGSETPERLLTLSRRLAARLLESVTPASAAG